MVGVPPKNRPRCVLRVPVSLGVAVVIEARHLCMMMRGVEKQNSLAVTSCMLGEFKENSKTRNEFIELLKTELR